MSTKFRTKGNDSDGGPCVCTQQRLRSIAPAIVGLACLCSCESITIHVANTRVACVGLCSIYLLGLERGNARTVQQCR